MPEHNIAGGEIWLYPDEVVAKIVTLPIPGHIGLITTRASGFHYASVLKLGTHAGMKFEVPRWETFCGIDRSICDSIMGAENVIRKYQTG